MSDEQVDSKLATADAAAKVAKKRVRAKAKALGGDDATLTVLDQRFVCNYSGRVIKQAIFIPGHNNVCFANIPCAFAWLDDHSNATPEEIAKLKEAVCEEYEQPLESIVRAPPRNALSDFGGDQTYDAWFGLLRHWDILTETRGTTVVDFRANQKTKGKSASKKGKGAAAKVVFEPAMYVISYGKSAAGCKKINALDGAVEKGDKDRLTPVAAIRKITTFINAHTEPAQEEGAPGKCPYARVTRDEDGFHFQGLTALAAEEKYANHIATQLVGLPIYGPAVVFFTRKTSVKV